MSVHTETAEPTAPSITFAPVALRLFVAVLLLVQLAGSYSVATRGFIKSYWFVDYDHGFVRRGLGGALVGDSATAVRFAVLVSALLPVAAVVLLIELLIRRMTVPTAFMAMLLACSPFVVDQLVLHRRPDQLGLVVLVLVGVACVYTRRLVPVLGALGIVLAVLVFVHEGALLFFGVFAVPLIFVATDRTLAEQVRLSVLTIGPAGLAVLVVFFFGGVDVETSAALRADAAINGPTVFRFLADDIATSWDHIASVGLDKHLMQLTVGGVLIAAQALWIRQWVGREWEVRTTDVTPLWRAGLVVCVGVPILFTFATGMDWMRWFSVFGTSVLVVVGFAVLVQARDDSQPLPAVPVRLIQLVCALYLASLTPLPEFEPTIPIPDQLLLDVFSSRTGL
ncbi:hypothetical protein [Antrihabitans sp. YC2-6]|uniref:hypothetical protein n=1 Tax=Antrihabitans sp. YC2-6 TaxID=2799498 RepID=UPI0018F37DDD|nr:hypothetical protein [Antrihabitans sp. YC2-6]MBJ8347774.1 hypothetical protein [Antrihabitans sp. YC2-6]